MPSSSSDALLSQELFDQTILENKECFDLSPDDALRETIDQFCQQLGASPSAAAASSSTSIANSGGGAAYAATLSATEAGAPSAAPPPPPEALSHLILSHPDSADGRRDRTNRNTFRNRLNSLDECVDADGTVRNSDGDGEDDGEGVLEALADVGRRCRTGDTSNGGENNDNVKNDEDDDDNPLPYLAMLQRTSSIYTLMSFLSIVDLRSDVMANDPLRLRILGATARTLSSVLAGDDNNRPANAGDRKRRMALRAELRDSFVPALGRLVGLIGGLAATTAAGTAADSSLQMRACCDLLQLGTNATRGCEGAKVAFVQSVLPLELSRGADDGGTKRGGVAAILACLSSHASKATDTSYNDDDSIAPRLLTEACNLLASLCRYDDFRDPASSTPAGAAGVSTSSAHDHAMEFHRAGAATSLMDIARRVPSKSDDGCEASTTAIDERLASSALTALRVLAVNDEIIQTMVALGVLPVVARALRSSADGTETETEPNRKRRSVASSLGLLRNLCGNDEVKTNLCLGSKSSPPVLQHLLTSMRLHPAAGQIQEHGCGALAAMALRRPANARAILDADGQRWVLAAMRRHESNVNVQRQGALAVRNVVSRLLRDLPEDEGRNGTAPTEDGERSSVRDAFLDLGAEEVLRNIAGRHQGSVDEAYAALRDLGCAVSLVKFHAEDLQGRQSGVNRTMMFGEKHNSNFRPVYEESAGLSEGVDNAVSRFGN